MNCVICGAERYPYTVIKGSDVCLECVDIIVLLHPGRGEHEHEWGWWHSVSRTDVVRLCMVEGCDEEQSSEGGICEVCGTFVVELQINEAINRTELVPFGNWQENEPCADENGLPVPHRLLRGRK